MPGPTPAMIAKALVAILMLCILYIKEQVNSAGRWGLRRAFK